MKTEQVAEKLGAIIYVHGKRDAKELYQELKGAVMMPQINSALKMLVDQQLVTVEDADEKVKKYLLTRTGQTKFKDKWPLKAPDLISRESLGNTEEKSDEEENSSDDENEEEKETVSDDTGETKSATKPAGRDLTKYTFNGLTDLSKGRLALAVIRHIGETHTKLKLKDLLEKFPDTMVAPYGVIKPKKEALEISKGRPRFFIKQEEMVKLSDGDICVSNQWTAERINEFISVAKKEYGLKIKGQ